MNGLVSLVCCCTSGDEAKPGHLIDGLHSVVTETPGESGLAAGVQRPQEAGFVAPNFRQLPCTTPTSGKATALNGNGDGRHNPPPARKEVEKARLQEVVREFSKEAMTGIKVNTIDADNCELTETVMLMDKCLSSVTLRTPRGRPERRFNMKDLSAIYKGIDFTAKVPKLAHLNTNCMGLDFCSPEDTKIFLHFKDSVERDQFYTCLKILRMSVDINSARLAARASEAGTTSAT